jgi:GrpB-like predicted nucleotidyltransferase (UPF0157 family)
MKKLTDRVQKAVGEKIEIARYDPVWPDLFRREARRLRRFLPAVSIRRIEHFGSTAVPGLASKPIIDILVEVSSLHIARKEIAPILKAKGYEYFWRPTFGDDVPPWYPFFIRRNKHGVRTHHIHVVTRHPAFAQHWERLLFRDYLIAHRETARDYEQLKVRAATAHLRDRVAYTKTKTEFVRKITNKAKSAIRR